MDEGGFADNIRKHNGSRGVIIITPLMLLLLCKPLVKLSLIFGHNFQLGCPPFQARRALSGG